jgi:prephenate dehydrogenase
MNGEQHPWRVEIVGGGLIGTSIALKVAKIGSYARIVDQNEAHQRVGNELLGSQLLGEEHPADLIVAATPVDILPEVILTALSSNPTAIVIDTGSIKTKVVLEISTNLKNSSRNSDLARFVPSHPLAGRELSGPDGARSDLFEGRAWAVTPHADVDSTALRQVMAFVQALGATPYQLSPEEHDREVALTSHAPQVLASALAGALVEPLDLAGQGLRDMTRLANSDIAMWQPILEGNQEALIPVLERIIKSINCLIDKNFDKEIVLSFMQQGAVGSRKVPGKHGGIPRNYGSLSVVIPDKAGELARLFKHCAEARINIEDLRIEHSPGQETGLISLFVQPSDLSTLNDYLSTLGWHSTILSKEN